MKKLLAGILFLSSFNGFAQTKDPVLMTIGGKDVTKSEFEAIYHKNNNKETSTDKKSLDEYVDLFINFKLKVREAESLGLDTSESFKNELEGYRRQLAQPYLVDNEVNEKLLKEAYERTKTDIRASHILIKLDQNALPKDTLAAYNKVMALRARILKGEDFEKLAKENSDDPSAKDNGGDLGFFTVMQMVYPFENAAYNTPKGEISMPVRTRFGYHLVKVTDRRDAQGQILVGHIMIKSPKTATEEEQKTAKSKIDEIYQQVKAGKDFAELAREHSDDKGSSKKGGELMWFGTGKMVPEFEVAAFGIKNKGDFTEPIKTVYGWHIIKKLDKKDLPGFDEVKADLKGKIAKDSRSQKSRESLIAKLKKEYSFKENPKTKDEFYKALDTTYFAGTWKAASLPKKMNKTMFSLLDKNYSQQDFAKYLESQQTKRQKTEIPALVDQQYRQFVESSIIAFEESRLPQKYPEYRALLQEYRDGILLFDLTDKKVWSRAVKDTVGLKEFYEKNKNNFMWQERAEATIYTCANDAVAKSLRAMLTDKKKTYTNDEILANLNKDSKLNLKVESGKFQKNENEHVDKTGWKPGVSEDMKKDNQVVVVKVDKIIPPEPKTLNESKGLVTAEYQNFIEKQWIEELKAKYPVMVNKEILATVK